jgi:hypothetical protein
MLFNEALANPASVPFLSSPLKYRSNLTFFFSPSGVITALTSTVTDLPAATSTSSEKSSYESNLLSSAGVGCISDSSIDPTCSPST